MITYHKSPVIRVAEFHFDEHVGTVRGDIVRYLWRSVPLAGVECAESHTLVLDLSNSADGLLANMHTETRYRIRRGEKDHFLYEVPCPAEPAVLEQFCQFYKRFAAGKHLVAANRARLSALANAGVLDLSSISDETGKVLVWHVHYRSPERARLFHSASLLPEVKEPALRARIGTANRYHTWSDMMRFKEHGTVLYDLGGWYGGSEDPEKLRINTFKRSFGGEIIREFNVELGATPVGRLALRLKTMMLACRGWSWLDLLRAGWQAGGLHQRRW